MRDQPGGSMNMMRPWISAARRAHSQETELGTEHLGANIRSRTVFGAVASAGGQGGQIILTLGYNAALARLISPHDFGLVAMALTVAGFLQVFKDAGLSTATIQREDITHAQVSNLFWINVAAGGVAMFIMVGTAPLAAWFFQQPELVGISIALSVGFLLEALIVQHSALLNRQMRFTLVSGLDLTCTAAGFLGGLIMALTGWGYWSLVGASLMTSTLRIAGLWTLSGWWPQRPVRGSGTRPLVRFGTELTVVGVVYAVSRGCDSLLVGRYLGSDALGVYSRATALLTRPLERLMVPVFTVMVPALSRLQGQPDRYRKAFVQVFEALAIGAFVLAGLLYPLSTHFVALILGQGWDAAAPVFAALTVGLACLPLATATSWLFTSQGRGRDLLTAACLSAPIMVAAFAAGLPFGPAGVATGYSAATLLAILPLTFYLAGRRGPVSTRDLWSGVIGHLPVLVTVLAATWLAREWVVPSATVLVKLAFCLTMGTAAGSAAVWISPRSRSVIRALPKVKDLRPVRGD